MDPKQRFPLRIPTECVNKNRADGEEGADAIHEVTIQTCDQIKTDQAVGRCGAYRPPGNIGMIITMQVVNAPCLLTFAI